MAQPPIELPWGRIEFGLNEMSIISTVDDPPKIRLAAPGGCPGAISFNYLRPDGKQEELGMINISRETFGPMLKIFLSDDRGSEDVNMRRILEASFEQGVTCFVPFRASNGFRAG